MNGKNADAEKLGDYGALKRAGIGRDCPKCGVNLGMLTYRSCQQSDCPVLAALEQPNE